MGHNFAASTDPFFTSCNTNRVKRMVGGGAP